MATYGPARRWLESYFEDEDILFSFEVGEVDGEYGWVLRQVELHGPDRVPTAAASLAELPGVSTEEDRAALRSYEAIYGVVADQPLHEWDQAFPHEDITQHEFESRWETARAHLERA